MPCEASRAAVARLLDVSLIASLVQPIQRAGDLERLARRAQRGLDGPVVRAVAAYRAHCVAVEQIENRDHLHAETFLDEALGL